MKKVILYLLTCNILPISLIAQDDTTSLSRKDAITIFISDPSCDQEYIKQELTFVNYVRDRTEARVLIMGTSQNTGGSGVEHKLFFVGQKDFIHKNDTLSFVSKSDATDDEIRQAYLKTLKLGLVSYLMKTSFSEKINVSFESDEKQEEVKDKWDSWVFNMSANAYMNGEKSYNNFYGYGDLSAERITEQWKLEIAGTKTYSFNTYDTGDEIYKSESKANYANVDVVKSLTDHWSAGLFVNIHSSTYNNVQFNIGSGPAIEYNIFKYSESARKQIRIKYGLSYEYYDYVDTTLYNKLQEKLFNENLSIAFKTIQKWGSISLSVSGNNYLHDFSKNSAYIYSVISLKIVKGLSFDLTGQYSFIRNQLSLPKEGASLEEILLRQRQLATDYSYYMSIGIQYTFGSIYNNVVNPRFGN